MRLSSLEKITSNITKLAVPEVVAQRPWRPREIFPPELWQKIVREGGGFSSSTIYDQAQAHSKLLTLFPEHRDELHIDPSKLDAVFQHNGFKLDFFKHPKPNDDALHLISILGNIKPLFAEGINALLRFYPKAMRAMENVIRDTITSGNMRYMYPVFVDFSIATGYKLDTTLSAAFREHLVSVAKEFETTEWWKQKNPFVTAKWAPALRLFLPEKGPLVNNPREVSNHLLDELKQAGGLSLSFPLIDMAYNVSLLAAEKVTLTSQGLELVYTDNALPDEIEETPVPIQRTF